MTEEVFESTFSKPVSCNWWPWRDLWDQFLSQSTQRIVQNWKGPEFGWGSSAGWRVQLNYLMAYVLAPDQRLSLNRTTVGQTKWWW